VRNVDWVRYVYQFSHEMCHTMINSSKFDDCRYWDNDVYKHSWFDESLCEMASFYVLDEITDILIKNPHHPLTEFTYKRPEEFREYAEQMQVEYRFRGKSLKKWFRENICAMENGALEDKFKKDPNDTKDHYKRCLQSTFADAILIYFQKNPALWRELTKLHLWEMKPNQDFGGYLHDWEEFLKKTIDPKLPNILRKKFGISQANR